MTTATHGSIPADPLTFDCPWCGAITPVPAGRIGEHFACPECRKETKLTDKNTASRPLTAPPPDAPHLTGDRTFDCPWCGMISAVPSSHLGERFHCSECGRETRLTPTNTRRAPVTAPPPDAPPVEGGGGKTAFLVVAAIAAIVVVLLATSGEKPKDRATAPSTPGAGEASVPPARREGPPVGTVVDPKEASKPSTPGAATPAVASPPPPAPDPDAERRIADVLAAKALLADRAAAHAAAAAAVDAWKNEHPEAIAAAADLPPALALSAEFDRRLAAKESFADPASPSAAEVRAFNAAFAEHVSADAARVRVLERVLARMADDRATARDVAGKTWKDLNFHGAAFRSAFVGLREHLEKAAVAAPDPLVRALADATAALEEARKSLSDAEARVAPPK